MTIADSPSLALRLAADRLEPSRYVDVAAGPIAKQWLKSLPQLLKLGDLQLTLQADELVINSIAAKDIAVDVAASGSLPKSIDSVRGMRKNGMRPYDPGMDEAIGAEFSPTPCSISNRRFFSWCSQPFGMQRFISVPRLSLDRSFALVILVAVAPGPQKRKIKQIRVTSVWQLLID